ncbi:hypothetical protein F5Y10DRAFT_259524 [Nemania abortiva]|nr:hypothetical protein F5Y10DRAFT_259524 [Nemania abortiva]
MLLLTLLTLLALLCLVVLKYGASARRVSCLLGLSRRSRRSGHDDIVLNRGLGSTQHNTKASNYASESVWSIQGRASDIPTSRWRFGRLPSRITAHANPHRHPVLWHYDPIASRV